MGPPAAKHLRRNRLIICSWNVEGLSDVKLIQICIYMRSNSIDICCLQETRKPKSDTYSTDGGFLVYLSGRGDEHREWAGVGFVVAPWAKSLATSFRPCCSRIASLKLVVSGGCMSLSSVYAPHNMKSLPDRVQFYESLDQQVRALSAGRLNIEWSHQTETC